jgi:hypothetical protein
MLPMKFSTFSLKTGVCLAVLLFTAQMFIPAFVPSAHALYWEDDTDFNAPQDRLERPSGGFFLFNWFRSIKKHDQRKRAKGLENRDKGPGVNGGKKALLMVTSGVVGVGVGLLISSVTTDNPDNRSRNNFMGAAFGLCGGLLVGSLITPSDYQVDSASLPNQRFRTTFHSDPKLQPIRAAFHSTPVKVALQF